MFREDLKKGLDQISDFGLRRLRAHILAGKPMITNGLIMDIDDDS